MNGHSFWGPILISCNIISIVLSQCLNGYENECVWTDDTSQPLRWVQKKDSEDRWVEVTKCPSPCGKAVLMSPWLPPRTREASWVMRHKLYGIQKVTVQLSLKTEDSGPRQLFFEKGNYADGKPEFWKATKVVLPPVAKKHRLLLEAVTPYADALVAVADVNTEAEVIKPRLPADTAPKTTPVKPNPPTSKKAVVLETRTVKPTSQIKEVSKSTETQTDSDYEEETEKENSLSPLTAGIGGKSGASSSLSRCPLILLLTLAFLLIGHPDLRRGYTVIMDPNICMYP